MKKIRVLTGITTTGTPHLGNYLGAIKPAIDASRSQTVEAFYFLADYHAIIKCQDPKRIASSRLEVAASWLAMGLDTDNVCFYRQSDIPEILELTWILNCVAAKGLLNRAHAYKAAVQINEEEKEKDPDKGISMGLFSYPVLMAADILIFNSNKVPVGKDQIQHIEMARDIAGRFNHLFGETFNLPEALIDEKTAILSGTDGRKMSKSYDNTIPLFLNEKQLRKVIMRIKTNSQAPSEPKDPDTCTLFEIYSAFAKEEEINALKKIYKEGIGWGDMKIMLFDYLNKILSEPRKKYSELIAQPEKIERVLMEGAEKARCIVTPFLKEIREKIGFIPFA